LRVFDSPEQSEQISPLNAGDPAIFVRRIILNMDRDIRQIFRELGGKISECLLRKGNKMSSADSIGHEDIG